LLQPSEDVDEDLRQIKKFFDTKTGLKAKNYAS
jgi:hypothetical protein